MRALTLIPSLLIAAIASGSEQRYGLSAPTPAQQAANRTMMLAPEILRLQPAHLPAQDPVPAPVATPAVVGEAPLIQIALLLDTSNSMDGLINQARSQLWAIVNSLGPATRGGQRPTIQVALYEYGKASIPAAENHLRQVMPFTTDLDRVSEQLFALSTNGGEEYCGAVIRAAARGLSWSTRPGDLKVMIVAGNEPFTQGAADYRPAVIEAANAQGIIINTIFCGPHATGLTTGWSDGAKLAGGAFAAIDQDRAPVVVAAPQDAELMRLGSEINGTYLPYGRGGKDGAARQQVQDSNSSSVSAGSFASRAACKAGANYRNDHWDLVDAVENKAVDLAALALADLPEGMRAMSHEQRVAYVAGKLAERRAMQERIGQLSLERERFLAANRKADATALDDVIITNMRDQAKRLGFAFP